MLRKILTLVIAILFTITGLILLQNALPELSVLIGYDIHSGGPFGYSWIHILFGAVSILVFGWIGWVITPFLIKHIIRFSERVAGLLSMAPSVDIAVTLIGVIIGLVLANLIGAPFSHLPIVGPYIPVVLSVIFALIGAQVALRKSKDILGFITRRRSRRARMAGSRYGKDGEEDDDALLPDLAGTDEFPMPQYTRNKLLDTSVIIDGRIEDVLKTGFLEGYMIVPHFVLDELQQLSDSADSLKRAKGRRGLDLIQKLQQENRQIVIIETSDYDAIPGVDSKLVEMAKDTGSAIVTNDFNLNKVATIQGIAVLNLNDLANALKIVVVPGQELSATLLREGKEHGQAVAYLQDGTMIVVEDGRRFIGKTVRVIVTSVFQTSAGRMIFAKLPAVGA
ncbi:MAG: PIN domain-containing protein [Succiniclasticum sp.]|nr:PIN domain-containing protein [Succiniclasticum sp.]MEE3479962.1 PIN domain-containing protein [Succiniclasticum sp.]